MEVQTEAEMEEEIVLMILPAPVVAAVDTAAVVVARQPVKAAAAVVAAHPTIRQIAHRVARPDRHGPPETAGMGIMRRVPERVA